jgi:hypothetical protein
VDDVFPDSTNSSPLGHPAAPQLKRKPICVKPSHILEESFVPTMSGPTPVPDFVILYRRAFEEFGVAALWSSRPVPNPTPADALAITHSLRVEGNLQARRLAEQIEQACRAAF